MFENIIPNSQRWFDLKTNEVLETYYSLKEAQEKTGIKYQNISACCRGITKYAGNYKWIYIN